VNSPLLRSLSIIFLCFVSFACSSAAARTWVVKPDGTGDAPTIQAGVDSAADGDVVLLANGTYRGEGNHDVIFGGKAITVASDSDIPDSCVIATYSSWDGGTCAIDWGPFRAQMKDESARITSDIFADAAGSNQYGFHFISGEDTTSVVRGIKFTGGVGIGGRKLSSPKVVNCVFTGMTGATLYYSDAMFVDCLFSGGSNGLWCQESSPQAVRCTFDGQCCECVSIYYGGYGFRPRPSFEHCTFKNNLGIDSYDDATIWTRSAGPNFCDCTFSSNAVGAISISRDGVTFNRCRFEDNHNDYNGGAIYFYNSTGEIYNCSFIGNSSMYRGGAVCLGDATCEIDSCYFEGNTADEGGAVACSRQCDWLTISNSTLVGNSATRNGGCIATVTDNYCGARIEISHCTLSDNATESSDGATIYMRSSLSHLEEANITNTIIAFSSSGSVFDWDEKRVPLTISCSNIYGNAGGDWVGRLAEFAGTNGNFSEDPLFCDREGGLFALNGLSPCLPGNHPDGSDCGLIGASGSECDPVIAQLDLFPGSCDNRFNMRWFDNFDNGIGNDRENDTKGGVLPAAVAGSAECDVTLIDVSSLELDGVAPLRSSFEDVTRPAEDGPADGEPADGGGDCPCSDKGPDGIPDLTLKFSRQAVASLLAGASSGEPVMLTLRGRMTDGSPFEARDCLRVAHNGQGGKKSDAIREIALRPAYPNPFNPSTTISFDLPEAMHVSLGIYDVQGKRVASLVNGTREAGASSVLWDGRDSQGVSLASGVYFYRLEAGGRVLTRRLVLVK
jgi:hypothetical protein